MSLSAILNQALNFFRNNISQLATLTIPILLIQVGLQMWLSLEITSADEQNPQFDASHMIVMMVLLLLFSLLIAALTLFLELRSLGHKPSNALVLKTSLNFVPGLLLAGVFSGLAILGPFFILAAIAPVLGVIGLAASFYIFSRLAFVNFMVVVERLTPMEAIKRSFVFSGPIVYKTMMIASLYIPLLILGGGLAKLVEGVGLPVQYLMDVVVAFLGLFINVALFRLYMVSREQTDESQNISHDGE
ncbi:hypothetical protein [uncultured Shewanella sp.]|uniref:hypothetical protein n=1 Tax=uncultured Shewanella sp. TaxID=173975 RepID=UPI0026065C45|nr:hypothetical protein [uncultured Shewanella sp.]